MGHVSREFTKILYQKRMLVGWAVLLILPFVLGVAIKASPPTGDGGDELSVMMVQVATNGLLLPAVVLGVLVMLLLPVLAAMSGAQAVAAEAERGTLRSTLMQPVGRMGVVVGKWAVANIYMFVGLAILAVASIAAGAFFGFHPLTLDSGETIGIGGTLLRTAAAFGYVAIGMVAIASVAVLLSTLTDSSLTAVAGTFILVIVMLVFSMTSIFDFMNPYLITSHLGAWDTFFGETIDWGPVWKGLVNFLVWGGGTLGLAIFNFRRKDILA